MKKSLFVSALATSLCLFGATAHADTHAEEAAKNSAASSVSARQSVSKPIYYGTEGDYPFSTAVRSGNTLYMSGELGMKDGKVVEGGIKAETAQALDNINQTLMTYGYQSSDLVKCMVMMADMDDFNDFNEVYQAKLSKPYPVRSAFAVKELALGANVEIECMAAK